MLSLAIILLLIPSKSKATLHLGITFLMLTVFDLGYFLSAMIYHPLAAYHRWLTAGIVTFAEIHFIIFLFYFPEERNLRAAKWIGTSLYAVSIVSVAAFFFITYNSPKIYNFDGHYWDFDADAVSKYIALLIIIYVFIELGIGIWKTVIIKTGARWSVLSITLIITVAILVPSGANLLSRNGIIDRGTYQMTQDLSTITGFFAVLVIYLNTTRDRTSLMVKILSICFATFLIVFQGLSLFSLTELDRSYDSLRNNDLVMALRTDRQSPELLYIVSYSCRNDVLKKVEDSDNHTVSVDFQKLKIQLFNTAHYEQISMLNGTDLPAFRKKLGAILDCANLHFAGYRAAITARADALTDTASNPTGDILAYISSIQPKVIYASKKISQIPDRRFRAGLMSYLEKSGGALRPFADAIRVFCENSGLEGGELKEQVLSFLAPMNPAGARWYRSSRDGTRHYTAFMLFEPDKELIYEGGFDYRAFRAHHHPSGVKFIFMLAFIVIVIFGGFQFFFLGAFVHPVKRLLNGIKQVSEGNYDVVVPVPVRDELGYISHSFNEMVSTLSLSKEVLSEYAENLEKMVEERTEQLAHARDELWGEMELARKIQTILLPQNPAMQGYDIAGYMMPAQMVGGDYYDIINVEGLDWIVIGDVSGHGVPAGIIMMMVQTSIHSVLSGHPNLKPSILLKRVNGVIKENIEKLREDKYMTITVMACLKNGEFYFSGLHQDIMIYRQRNDSVEIVKTDGIWLGLKEHTDDMITEHRTQLESGDIMLLYTDGVTEPWIKGSVRDQRVAENEMFGDMRLKEVFYQNRGRTPEEIKNAILESLCDYDLCDDVTMIVIRRK